MSKKKTTRKKEKVSEVAPNEGKVYFVPSQSKEMTDKEIKSNLSKNQ